MTTHYLRVRKNGNNQKVVPIPKKVEINIGDYVIVKKTDPNEH